MKQYESEDTKRFEEPYTLEELELNNRLYEECSKETLDCNAIEALLVQGADPLGALSNRWGVELDEHVYGELIYDSEDLKGANLPKITELFLKHGMDVAKPRVPYDDCDSMHPLWHLTFVPNENSIEALKLLLDNGLDVDSAGEFIDHSISDQLNVDQDDPNDPQYVDWFVWTFKMIMLIASYDHIIDNDANLRRFIECSNNNYDLHKFREWDNYRYEFDTSRCLSFPELYKSVIRIYEIGTNQEVWRIGIGLKDKEV